MEYALTSWAGGAARLGLIVLQTDETLEFEARQVLAGRDVQLLHARIATHSDMTPEVLVRMEAAMPAAAALLPEGMDVIGYACTSGTTIIGQDRVAAQIRSVHPAAAVSEPVSAVLAALAALGAGRIGMVTPYLASVTGPMRALLAQSGVTVAREVSFGEGDDRRVARIDPASTRAALLAAADAPGVEALFASCTNLQTFTVIAEIEAATGLPVVTSNQALLWHMLRLANVPARGWGPGRLFGM